MNLALLLALAPVGPQQLPPPIGYQGGLRLSDPSGVVQWKVNGRLMLDALEAEQDLAPDDREVRRARILAQGSLGPHLGARLQWDFSDSEEDLLEGMVDWHTFPLGTLRVGHFREPSGLNARTSSATLSFLERSAPSQAFTAGRNRGVQVRERGEQWSLAAGLFQTASSPFPDEGVGNGVAVTARGTWLPVREEGDERLIHLGASASLRDPNGDGLRLSARPGSSLIEPLVDTGELAVERATFVGLEAALIEGPLSAMAEAFVADIELPDSGGAPWGISLQTSYFLTGERRSYRDSSSSFGPPSILQPVPGGGPGAWELVARWSRTDLDEGAVDGGTLDDRTVGANWYLSDHARLMLGYLDIKADEMPGRSQALTLRLHLGF